ncbi:hypothetical protein BGZ67_005727 [Mortierella alpina]|nr:hypothetical protein BGZ67_005727 [Mortierella alpina]
MKSYNAEESEQDTGESTVYSDLHLTDMKHRQSTSSRSRARPDILDMDAPSDEDLQEASMTAPEPIAPALITATASKTDMDSRQATPCNWNVGHEKGYDLRSYKVRPPEPIPEPMPALATGSPQHLQHSGHDQQQQPQQQQHYHQEQGSSGSLRKFKTIIHRVTTLIIETETIIAPPRATKALRHDKRHDHDSDPHPGDHVMFDAGVEGDMVVSIVSSKHATLQHQHHKNEHRKQKSNQSSNKNEL